MDDNNKRETLIDLFYIKRYADCVYHQILREEKPVEGYVNQIIELSNKVKRRINDCRSKTRT